MELIADGVLVLAALAATVYCMVLSRRLRRLMRTDGGLGEAIAAMSHRVNELQEALRAARSANEQMVGRLGEEIAAAAAAREALSLEVGRAQAQARDLAAAESPDAAPPETAAGSDAESAAPAPEAAQEAVGPVRPKRTSREPGLDGLISAYLDAHSGESEERMAQRLVSALASRPEEWGGRT